MHDLLVNNIACIYTFTFSLAAMCNTEPLIVMLKMLVLVHASILIKPGQIRV